MKLKSILRFSLLLGVTIVLSMQCSESNDEAVDFSTFALPATEEDQGMPGRKLAQVNLGHDASFAVWDLGENLISEFSYGEATTDVSEYERIISGNNLSEAYKKLAGNHVDARCIQALLQAEADLNFKRLNTDETETPFEQELDPSFSGRTSKLQCSAWGDFCPKYCSSDPEIGIFSRSGVCSGDCSDVPPSAFYDKKNKAYTKFYTVKYTVRAGKLPVYVTAQKPGGDIFTKKLVKKNVTKTYTLYDAESSKKLSKILTRVLLDIDGTVSDCDQSVQSSLKVWANCNLCGDVVLHPI